MKKIALLFILLSTCVAGYSQGVGVKSVANSKQAGVQVSPNPTSAAYTMNILTANNEQANVVVTDMLGKQVLQFTVPTNSPTIINSTLAHGMYFICASTSDNKFVTKLVVE